MISNRPANQPIVFKLAYYPSLILLKRTLVVTDFEHVPMVVNTMFQMVALHKAYGLAANQCKLPMRLFVMRTGSDMRKAFINPNIVETKGKISWNETCLSFPGYSRTTIRAQSIVMQAQDIFGNMFETELKDLDAVVAQHEVEHLDGKTFIDDYGNVKKQLTAGKVKKALKNI